MYWNVCKSCSRSNVKDYLNIRKEKAVCVLHHCTGHMMDYCKTLHGTTNATNARSHHVCALALTTVYASVCKCMHFFCSCFIFFATRVLMLYNCTVLTSTCWSQRWTIQRTTGRGCKCSGRCPLPAESPWGTGCRGAASPSWTSGLY